MTDPNQNRTALFVSLTGDQQIKLYDLDATTGALHLRTTSDAHGPSGALFLHPKGDVLYDAHVGSTELASYRFDADSGELHLINKVTTGIETPAHLVTDRAGRFLLTAYYTGGGITVHRLAEDGAIGELVQYINTGEKAHAVLLTPDEQFVFVPHVCPTNKTSQFRFDNKTGQLTPNEPADRLPPDEQSGPRHICLGPKGNIAYIVNEQGNTITVHQLDAALGTLSIVQHLSTLPESYTDGGFTAHIEVHPNGKWLYASNRGHDSIAGFSIAEDGTLSPMGHYAVPASPRSFNIDPTGRYLYCAGEAADQMNAYAIDGETGALTLLTDYAVGVSPFWVMMTTLTN